MLERLQDQARRFYSLRQPLLILSLLALLSVVLVLVLSGSHTQDVLLIPLLLFFIWVTMLFSCINLFTHVPRHQKAGGGWLRRLLTSLKRGVFYLFALIFLVISIGLIVTTYQLIMVWVYMYIL